MTNSVNGYVYNMCRDKEKPHNFHINFKYDKQYNL